MTRTLYVLCGEDPNRRFSPHAWKAVMSLHHKGLDFTEVPTPFTEIKTIEGGASPIVPLLRDGDALVRDSFAIADYLEATYPDRPSLFGGEGGRAACRLVEGYSQTIIQAALMKIIVKDIHDSLAPVDQAYFRASREQRLGRTLEDVDAGADVELAAFAPRLEPLRHVLKLQPFIGGDGPLFSDYIIFGALQWARVVSPRPILAADDIVSSWFERCLDLYGGAGRTAATA